MDTSYHATRMAQRVSEMKLALYTQLLRKNLAEAGFDADTFDSIAQATILELGIRESEENLISRANNEIENRGIDMLGRLIVEHCFVRTSSGTMIWPVYSSEDTSARWHHVAGVLPRPLMRYFLVSLRGTIPPIDQFSTQSFFFERRPDFLEQVRREIDKGIDEHKGPFGAGESSIDWYAFYDDPKFRRLTLEIVSTIRSELESSGPDTYLEVLEGYRAQDPESDSKNLMQRPFTREDYSQIDNALITAEKQLMDTIEAA